VTITKTVVERANLMDVSGGREGGVLPPAADYTLVGTVDENDFEAVDGTFEAEVVAWKTIVTPSAAQGGFSFTFPVDPTKTYRFILYLRKGEASVNGETSFGCSMTTTEALDGTPASTPFFLADLQLVSGQDYIMVGVIHPTGYSGGDTGIAGLYEATSFEKVAVGTEFRMIAAASTQVFRMINEYIAGASDTAWCWNAMIHEVLPQHNTIENFMLACQMETKALTGFIGSFVSNRAFIETVATKVIEFEKSVSAIQRKVPQVGDLEIHMGLDPRRPDDSSRIFEFAIREFLGHNGGTEYTEEWMNHFLTKKMGSVYGLILSGALMSCGGVMSRPGMLWTSRTHPFGTNRIVDVVYGNGVCVAVGINGNIAYSPDAITWTLVSSPPIGTSSPLALVYGDGLFVLGTYGGKIAYSSDGINWTLSGSTIFSSTSQTIEAMAYGNGIYIAGGTSGGMAYSDDGETWTQITPSAFGITSIETIYFGNGLFIAAGSSGKIAYSSDGINWTLVTSYPLGSVTLRAGIYGNGVYLLGGTSGVIGVSVDGIN